MLKFGKSNYGIPYNQQHHFYQHKLWGELKKKKNLMEIYMICNYLEFIKKV